MLKPPMAMIAGKGAVPDAGVEMVTVKEMDLPWSETLMVRVLPENEPVTLCGLLGKVPSS